MKKLKLYVKLFIAFFKVGLFTIGGGYAMLPIVERELVDASGLSEREAILDNYSLAQTLPGVVAANAATLMGFHVAGFRGALFSVLGVITPSVFILVVVAIVFQHVGHHILVQRAFIGIRIAVLALLIDSFVRLYKMALFDKKTKGLAGIAFIIVMFGLFSPIWVILLGALMGIVIYRERVGY